MTISHRTSKTRPDVTWIDIYGLDAVHEFISHYGVYDMTQCMGLLVGIAKPTRFRVMNNYMTMTCATKVEDNRYIELVLTSRKLSAPDEELGFTVSIDKVLTDPFKHQELARWRFDNAGVLTTYIREISQWWYEELDIPWAKD